MRSLALAGAVLALCAGAVDARPYTIEDLLRTEAAGAAGFDPLGRWLVFERRGALGSAPAFEGAEQSHRLATDLLVMDTAAPAPRPMVVRRPQDAGLIAGPFSPDGERLAVVKVSSLEARLGILRLGADQPVWLDATPNWTMYGEALVWRNSHQLLAIIRNARGLPPGFRSDAAADRAAADLSGMAWRGEASATVNGSGRWAPRAATAPQSLVLIDAITGVQTVMAQGDFEDMALSTSGRYVALLTRITDRPPYRAEAFRGGETLVRRQLRLVDLITGAVLDPCPGRDLAALTLRWSPVVDELLVMDQRSGRGGEPEALRVSAATGVVVPLAPPELMAAPTRTLLVPSVAAYWMGADPVLYASVPGALRPDWYLLAAGGARNLTASWSKAPPLPAAITPEGLLFADDDGALELIDRQGRRRPVGGRAPAPPVGSGARRRTDPLHLSLSDLARPSISPPGVELLAESPRSALLSIPSPRGALVEVRRQGAAIAVTTLNAHLGDVDLIAAEPIVEESSTGAVTHWLYRPAGDALAPLVVMPYPGSVHSAPPEAGRGDRLTPMTGVQILTGAGYAVLIPSLPPLPGPADPARITAQVDRAVSAALAIGGIDPGRMAVWGHSFGGYATLAIATQSRRYRAYIAMASVSDLATAWGRFNLTQAAAPAPGLSMSGAGWAENGQAGLGGPPWSRPSAYVAGSPLYAADRITRPVLLIHGEIDFLPVGQAQAMFTALQRQGKDVQLATYFGEGHVFGSPGNLRDLYRRALEFLSLTLQPAPTPRTEAAPAGPSRP